MSERESQIITPADVASLSDVLGQQPAIVYTCNGPKVRQSEEWLAARVGKSLEKREKGLYKLNDNEAAQLNEMVAGAAYQFNLEGIFGRDSEGPFTRETCGTNVTAQIAEVPEDGEVYEVKCPRCETAITVRRTPPAPTE